MGGEKLINPMVLTADELVDYGRRRGLYEKQLIFGKLYVEYYQSFYAERFNRQFERFDLEVQAAYDYWQAKPK